MPLLSVTPYSCDLSIRAKQIAGVTAIVGVTVVVLSGLYLARLAGVIVDESYSRAQILGYTILHRVTQLDIDPADRYAAAEERRWSALDSRSQHLRSGGHQRRHRRHRPRVIVMHREPRLVGEPTPVRGRPRRAC